jgi:WD40 repeat protein
LEHHSKTVNVVKFSPDGKYLASGGDGKKCISFSLIWFEISRWPIGAVGVQMEAEGFRLIRTSNGLGTLFLNVIFQIFE